MYPQFGTNKNNLSPNNPNYTNQPSFLTPNNQPNTPNTPNNHNQNPNLMHLPDNSRTTYTSIITPQSNPSFDKTLGDLSNMGRTVKEEPDPIGIKVNEAPTSYQLQAPNTLSFRSSG